MPERKKILVTVKTYPQPSDKYHETVCTAGVCEDGSFIRIYPMPFRSLEDGYHFKKYQWITVDVEKNISDPRPESYKAYPSTLELGEHISSKKWDVRAHHIFKKHSPTTQCKLNELYGTKASLGIVKPKEVRDFTYEPDSPEWSPKQKEGMRQLFLDRPACTLEKIPWRFKYDFLCENPRCKGHYCTIEDWEVFQLFRNMRQKYGESTALTMVKDTFLNKLCSPKKDVHFFVGMHNRHRVWMIIGLFCPPKVNRQLLLL